MKWIRMPVGWIATIALAAPNADAQEKALLQHKGVKGQVMTYKSERAVNAEAMGNRLNFEFRIAYRDTITEVNATGEVTRERGIDDAEATFNGEKSPAPPEVLKQKRLTTYKPDGSIVSTRNDRDENAQQRRQGNREFIAQWFAFDTRPVGVGDKWSHTHKEDDAIGTSAAIAEYELTAFERVNGIETAKVKMSYRETSGDRKLSVTGEGWIERASGDVVKAEYKAENVVFGPPSAPPASGTYTIERTAGTPNPAAGQASASAPPKKDKQIEEVVKDYEKLTGLFTIYKKKESGRETVYLEIKDAQLDKLHLLQVTASTGVGHMLLAAGEPLDDMVFKFVRRDEQVLLTIPNMNFSADPQKPIARAVKRSFAEAHLDSFKVEAKNDERKSLLINVTDLFRSDIAQFTTRALIAAGAPYSIDKEKTAFNAIKAFPSNVYVQTAYNLTRSGGGGPGLALPGLPSGGAPIADARSIALVINYNLMELPTNNGYRARRSDPRVGYFVTESDDLTAPQEDLTRRYIFRWHLEKASPGEKLSLPKEPIVFWLDNAIPEEYRDPVRRGLLLWNKAFEKIGLKDVVVVKQMPDDADWDHADMRYNVIRWVASPSNGYAVAQFRVNPLSGQILNASITVDSSITRFAKMEYDRLIDPLSLPSSPSRPNSLSAFSRYRCTYAQEALPNAWLGLTAMNLLAGGTKVSEKKYIDDFLVAIVAHEMGHIMGLRHNFVASTQHTLKQLGDGARMRAEGVVASVMDYNPYNPMALRSKEAEYWTTTLGAYDQWAIEYGYSDSTGATTDAEKDGLRKIASRTNSPGFAYQSDEVADQFDPLVTRFDLGKDPLDYWSIMLTDVRALLVKLPQRLPERGENYWQFTRYFLGLLRQEDRAAAIVSRYLGGLRLSGNHRGDPGERAPLVPVIAADQQRALELLRKHIFAREAFAFPSAVLVKLGPNPYPDLMMAITGGLRQDAPVRDTIGTIQANTLARLFHPTTLNRMANNEFKTKDTLTIATLFRVIGDTVWEEAHAHSAVDTLRRQLQRAHLTTLTGMITSPAPGTPEDARMLARHHARKLKTLLTGAQSKTRDEVTRIHYAEAIDQIHKALEARPLLLPAALLSGGGMRR